jgi:hypothetical protein
MEGDADAVVTLTEMKLEAGLWNNGQLLKT